MKMRRPVVYIGPEPVFHGLRGHLIDAVDPETRASRLYFQPESEGIRAVPCNAGDVQPADQPR